MLYKMYVEDFILFQLIRFYFLYALFGTKNELSKIVKV